MSTITCSAAFGVPVPLYKVTDGKVIVIENFSTYKNTKFPKKFILRSSDCSETPVFEMNIDVPVSRRGKRYLKDHSLNIKVDTSNTSFVLIPIPSNEEEEAADPTMFFKLNYSLENTPEANN